MTTHASFFSGVGGLDLGLERAGWQTVSVSEIDPYACAVLALRFPDAVQLGSIVDLADAARGREVAGSGEQLRQHADHDGGDASGGTGPERSGRASRALVGPGRPEPDAGVRPHWRDALLWTGGFPCQDLSVAGKRRGLHHDGERTRSGLAFAFLDLVERYAGPTHAILLENVPGLLSSNAGRDLGALLGALGELGYGWAYRVLDASQFGVPQRRRRVFICALRRGGHPDPDGAAEVLAVGSRCERDHQAEREAWARAAGGAAPRPVATGGHGSVADGALTTRTLPAAMGHHGYAIGAQDADSGWLQVAGITDALPASLGHGLGHNKDGFIVATNHLARAVHTSTGRRSGPAGDEVAGLVVSPSPDPDGVRAADGLARRVHHRAGLEAWTKVARPHGPDGDGERRDRPDVTPTLNGFDVGDTRAVTLVAGTLQGGGETHRGQRLDADSAGGGLFAIGDAGPDDPLLPPGLDSHRYRCCGNGVVAPVAEWIGHRLMAWAQQP